MFGNVKKYGTGVTLIFFFFLALPVSASQFPNDAQYVSVDAHSGTSGTLLASSVGIKTILQVGVSCDTSADNHIRIGTSGSNYLLDTEQGFGFFKELSYKLASNTELQWQKQTSGHHCAFSLVFVPYDLSAVPSLETTTGQVLSANSASLSKLDTLSTKLDSQSVLLSDLKSLLNYLWVFGQSVAVLSFVWIMYRAFTRWIY